MRIEKLSGSPDRAGRYHVCFDDGGSLRLYRQTVEDFGLYVGMDLDADAYNRLIKAAEEMSAKMRAVRIVSATSVSKNDLERRLIQKGEDPEQAHNAVQWLEELQLLDDRKTAEQIVAGCISKGYGVSRAKQALYEKRIPRGLWELVLMDYPDQAEKLTAFLRGKLGEQWTDKDLKKAIDAAMRRGHSYSHIRNALRRLQCEGNEFPEDW